MISLLCKWIQSLSMANIHKMHRFFDQVRLTNSVMYSGNTELSPSLTREHARVRTRTHLIVDGGDGGEGRIEELVAPEDGVQPVDEGDGNLRAETCMTVRKKIRNFCRTPSPYSLSQ